MSWNEQICGFAYFEVTGIVGEMTHLMTELTSALCGGHETRFQLQLRRGDPIRTGDINNY